MAGNPAGGILVLLLALYLLLAFFEGRLEWLFSMRENLTEPGGPGDPGDVPASSPRPRPSTVWRRG